MVGKLGEHFLRDERPHNFGFKNNDVMVPTDNGVFRSTDNGLTWLLPNSIVDEESNNSLKTKIFYSADSYQNNIWLGSADGLVRLQETPGKVWEGTWKIFFASKSIDSNNETYCYPNPFNPRQEELKIKYSTGGTEANVTIRIFDFGFNYVRTVIQNASQEIVILKELRNFGMVEMKTEIMFQMEFTFTELKWEITMQFTERYW